MMRRVGVEANYMSGNEGYDTRGRDAGEGDAMRAAGGHYCNGTAMKNRFEVTLLLSLGKALFSKMKRNTLQMLNYYDSLQ